MRLNRLLPRLLGVLSFLLVPMPTEAATLQFWRFEARENRLVFTTDEGVQPTAQLIFNPTRLIVDLPRTTLEGSTVRQTVGGGVREVRVGQVNAETTRLVIELAPGYTVDPQQIQVRGETSQRWIVQLPTLQRGNPPSPSIQTASRPDTPSPRVSRSDRNRVSTIQGVAAATQIDGIVATPDGFFVRTSGAMPEIEVHRSNDRDRQIIIEAHNATVSSDLSPQALPHNRYSIRNWEVSQQQTSPASVQITLSLAENSPNWRATASSFGGIVILPVDISISQIPDLGNPKPINTNSITARSSPQTGSRPRPQPAPTRRSNARALVVIDPGHGGSDPGAVGINGMQEKGIVLEISRQVALRLEQQGIQAVLTRRDDLDLDLDPRILIAEQVNADLLVSIHANAINLRRPDVNGLESYYTTDVGRQLAQVIHNTILQRLGVADRGIRESRFYILRHTTMPAVLIETGFLTGAQDARNLADPAWRSRMADAIAQGILQYVRQYLQ
ncbi:MAG: N-acetylmuramoyl-L-alanine amidase [Leptolyngbyaceae cyanobacterium MO_188.B28]|nr:N-acetylmuramoyl-L-alanine amidase [Leptolyngbyaceae cyanobacterium MO_188.B28]